VVALLDLNAALVFKSPVAINISLIIDLDLSMPRSRDPVRFLRSLSDNSRYRAQHQSTPSHPQQYETLNTHLSPIDHCKPNQLNHQRAA